MGGWRRQSRDCTEIALSAVSGTVKRDTGVRACVCVCARVCGVVCPGAAHAGAPSPIAIGHRCTHLASLPSRLLETHLDLHLLLELGLEGQRQ